MNVHVVLQQEMMKRLRTEALEYRHSKDEEKTKERNTAKDQAKKFSVREQIRIDSVEKEQIKV